MASRLSASAPSQLSTVYMRSRQHTVSGVARVSCIFFGRGFIIDSCWI